MATVQELVTQSLKDAGITGVGQEPEAEDTNDAFTKLNQLMALWTIKRQLVFELVTASFLSTGAISYTIGPGGNFNVAQRPTSIESAFVRLTSPPSPSLQTDYPIVIVKAREDYNTITLKSLSTWPSILFYDTAYPTGNIFLWPVPASGQFNIFVTYKNRLSAFTGLAQTVVLPPEYEVAITSNLALRLRSAYQLPPDPVLMAIAKDSLEAIRTAYLQIPLMSMPKELVGPGVAYNIYSDQVT